MRDDHPDWASLRTWLIDQYGEPPRADTEADIIAAYEAHPDTLTNAAYSIVADLAAGTIRSGWAVLRSRAQRITTPTANPTRSTSVDREKRIGRAEQWIRNAGKHYDRPEEIEDELNRGPLRDHPDTIPQLLEHWRQHRPEGEQIERDEIARAEAWKAAQHLLRHPDVKPL